MNQRFLLYDPGENSRETFPDALEDTILFNASPKVKPCVGCFGCWVKTPGACVIEDRCVPLPRYYAACGEFIIVSPLLYGGYSCNIKAVLERSIPYLMPYFRLVGGEMHHKMRYDNPFCLTVCFYGPSREDEKELARRLVRGNAVNLGAARHTVRFFDSISGVKEALF